MGLSDLPCDVQWSIQTVGVRVAGKLVMKSSILDESSIKQPRYPVVRNRKRNLYPAVFVIVLFYVVKICGDNHYAGHFISAYI